MARKITISLFLLLIVLIIIQFIDTHFRFQNGDFQNEPVSSILIYKIYPILVYLLMIFLLVKQKRVFYLGMWIYVMILFFILLIHVLFEILRFNFEWHFMMTYAIIKLLILFGLSNSLFKLISAHPVEPFNLRFATKRLENSKWDNQMHASIVLTLIFGWPYALGIFRLFTSPLPYLLNERENIVYGLIFITYLIGLIAKNRFLYLSFFILVGGMLWTLADHISIIQDILSGIRDFSGFGFLWVIIGSYVLIALVVILWLMIPVLKKVNALTKSTDHSSRS